jgi:uncharacterized repeat protein (TIGR02543 family)
MANINNISSFLTGHLVIDFSIISIDDYRSIMKSHYEQNETIVECYDPIYNNIATLKMYFATEERKKLYMLNRQRFNSGQWEDFLLLAGVQDYQLEMIGTNNDLTTVTVTYNLNAPSGTGNTTTVIGSQTVVKGGDFICGKDLEYDVLNETFSGRYRFVRWSTSNQSNASGDYSNYSDGYAYTLNSSMVLYAIWETTSTKTLTYSYGISDPMTVDGKPVFTKQVKKGVSIGNLPTFETAPDVTVDNVKYYPYTNGGWYKTPVKAENSVALTSNTKYWADTDDQIYLLYDTVGYTVEYYIGGTKQTTSTIEYNTAIPLLTFYKEGYTLSGWFTDSAMTKPAPQLMPPYPIKLYAKWN